MRKPNTDNQFFASVRVLAENPDNLPRLERIAQILRNDNRRFLGIERPPFRRHLSKLLRDCLLDGGILLAGHLEREILFCLALRPLETDSKKSASTLPRNSQTTSFEVVALGHNWGALRGMGIQLGEEEVMQESLHLLGHRLSSLANSRPKNEPSADGKRKVDGTAPKVYFLQHEFEEEMTVVQNNRKLLKKLSSQFTSERAINPITEQHLVLRGEDDKRLPRTGLINT